LFLLDWFKNLSRNVSTHAYTEFLARIKRLAGAFGIS